MLKRWLIAFVLCLKFPMAVAQDAPAPWTLKGDGYIILGSMSKEDNLQGGFINEALKERFEQSLSVVMLVDYKSSPVGPYQELLYIPGTFQFSHGRSYASISKIFVSSMASVLNGRKNWGIPKELASFTADKMPNGQEIIRVFTPQSEIASFVLNAFGPKIPIGTHFLPGFVKTLAQELNGTTYVFELRARGMAQLGVLDHAITDPEFFPDITKGKVLMALKISDFTLNFPVAHTSSNFP